MAPESPSGLPSRPDPVQSYRITTVSSMDLTVPASDSTSGVLPRIVSTLPSVPSQVSTAAPGPLDVTLPHVGQFTDRLRPSIDTT